MLLLASMLLYMDRQTLPSVSVRITKEFKLTEAQYGTLAMCFGYAFAIGALLFGWVADRWSVRWLYPSVVLAWSLMGFATGLMESYEGLLLCRTLLGFFEAGHWPCALKTTQRLLAREQRTMGNSVLQSGASVGAITTPLIITWMVAGRAEAGAWRTPFLIIGSLGLLWMVLWFVLLKERDFSEENAEFARAGDLQSPSGTSPCQAGGDCKSPAQGSGSPAASGVEENFFAIFSDRRFWTLVIVVACINACWQVVREWLPKFLIQGRGYAESEALYFNSLYYVATDVGCLAAGAATLWLAKRGRSVHGSRVTVFGVCALGCALTGLAAWLPAGWLLLGSLLVVAAGSLGLFPCYYSFSQELSAKHQGKVSGTLGFIAWVVSSPLQWAFGKLYDTTKSFDLGIALAGLTPLIGFAALILLWKEPAVGAGEKVGG